MRSAYLETLYNLSKKDSNVLALISDNGAIVYDQYRQDFPEQFINAGISEANMVGMAAGLADRGKIPFAYTIGAFLAYRAYEFIMNDVCLQNKNVKLVGIGSGFSYSLLGPSHHTIFDISALRPLPNLTIFSPASPMEVKKVVNAAYEMKGPVYIRLGTNREPEIYDRDYTFLPGKAVRLKDGNDITLVSTGSMVYNVLDLAEKLGEDGISASVINVHTIKPFDKDAILRDVKKTGRIVTIEEHSIVGGIGSIVAETLAENADNWKFMRIGLQDFVKGYGNRADVQRANRIDVETIVNKLKLWIADKKTL